jgi:hypothetical protein
MAGRRRWRQAPRRDAIDRLCRGPWLRERLRHHRSLDLSAAPSIIAVLPSYSLVLPVRQFGLGVSIDAGC